MTLTNKNIYTRININRQKYQQILKPAIVFASWQEMCAIFLITVQKYFSKEFRWKKSNR